MKRPFTTVIPAKAGIYYFLLFCLFVFSISISFATPPTSISLSYDIIKKNLHVEAAHPSFNLEKSYVRMMIIYVNGAQVSSLDYYRQNDYEKFTDDVPLTAQAGDLIKVDLFCSLGGEMAQEMAVTQPGPQPDQNTDTGTASSILNN